MNNKEEEEWMNAILDDQHSIWPTKASYWSYIRGSLRRASSRNPLKTNWKKAMLRPISKEDRKKKKFHPSTKNVGNCVICGDIFPGSKLEVDHITPSSCKDRATAQEFLFHCLGTTTDQYQLLCLPCHRIKTLADRLGITFKEAVIEKDVIAFKKYKAKEQIKTLELLGLEPEANGAKRIQQFRKWKNEKD